MATFADLFKTCYLTVGPDIYFRDGDQWNQGEQDSSPWRSGMTAAGADLCFGVLFSLWRTGAMRILASAVCPAVR